MKYIPLICQYKSEPAFWYIRITIISEKNPAIEIDKYVLPELFDTKQEAKDFLLIKILSE